MNHGTHHLDVGDLSELSGLLQVVETLHLHHLTGDLISNLVSPLVDVGHVDVVNEDGHFLAGRGTVKRTHTLVHKALHGRLEHTGSGGAGEVERFEHVDFWVVLVAVTLNDDGLGRTLFTNQQHCLALFGDGVAEEVHAGVVYVGHQDGQVVGDGVARVDVFRYARLPVLPVTGCLVDHILKDGVLALNLRHGEARLVAPEEVFHLSKKKP